MSATSFQIENRAVGHDQPPYVIAEAGVHHYNSVEIAKHYILSARIAGVDAIKFQTYKASRIAARWAPVYWGGEGGKTQHDVFAERDKLTQADYHVLFEYAKGLGVTMMSTPFDVDAAKMLDDFGMAAYKIASADITNLPLLKAVASFGKPVILSTGASYINEIRTAYEEIAGHGVPVALLHCTLTYPTPLAEANLQRIVVLKDHFDDCVIGYSDHTQPQDSEYTCALGVALGARIIEKHYTLNKSLLGDDHYHAVDQEGLIRLMKECRQAFAMTSGYSEMTAGETAARTYARRSIVAATDLRRGTSIELAHLDFKRPGTGMSPAQVDMLVGKRLKVDLKADQLVELDHLD